VKFGPRPLGECAGAVLAHGVRVDGGRIAKGTVLTAHDLEKMAQAGVMHPIVAVLDSGDVAEDEAALRLADAFLGPGLRCDAAATGRVNLFATSPGVLRVNARAVHAMNGVDPAVTLATLPDFAVVATGAMVATVKIIPFAVPSSTLDAALARLRPAMLALKPFRPLTVGLIQTELPVLKASVLDKTEQVTRERVAAHGGRFADLGRTAHETSALAARLAEAKGDITLVFGASAMTDGDDVIPAAIRACGGVVERVGMPVDPGNLLVLGRIGRRIVIGAPGCARSAKENGFDWVLARLFAGLKVTSRDIARMGAGGLLMEIPTRPRPRLGGSAPASGDE
jgi:molybdenum cofactor cytidylyltransferase